MPVEFLSDEQEKRYGCYNSEPRSEQLAKYFYLDDNDLQLIKKRRGNHNRLGLALQLCTVRFLGTFLTDPMDVPEVVVNYLSSQLVINNTRCLEQYQNSETKWEHTALIKQRYGYREFHSQPEHWKLVRWLYQRSTLRAESPSILFDLTTARLAERKILLPGVSVLARLVASVRERAPLDKLVDPPSLITLKRLVAAMLPKVDLPEVMLEINARTGFTKEFTHLSQANSRVDDLHISICAVLLASACNIGLEPLVRPEIPALTRGRLSWVQQNYIRQETLIRAKLAGGSFPQQTLRQCAIG